MSKTDSGDMPEIDRYLSDHSQNPDGSSVSANISALNITQSIGGLIHLASMVDQSDPFKMYIIQKGQHDFRFQRATLDNQVAMSKRITKLSMESNKHKSRLDSFDQADREDEINKAYLKGIHDHEKAELMRQSKEREIRLRWLAAIVSFGSPVICGIAWIIISSIWQRFFPSHPLPPNIP